MCEETNIVVLMPMDDEQKVQLMNAMPGGNFNLVDFSTGYKSKGSK